MTILKQSVYQIHGHLNGMLQSQYITTSLTAVLVQSRLLKLIITMQLSLVQLLQKYDLHVQNSKNP